MINANIILLGVVKGVQRISKKQIKNPFKS